MHQGNNMTGGPRVSAQTFVREGCSSLDTIAGRVEDLSLPDVVELVVTRLCNVFLDPRLPAKELDHTQDADDYKGIGQKMASLQVRMPTFSDALYSSVALQKMADLSVSISNTKASDHPQPSSCPSALPAGAP